MRVTRFVLLEGNSVADVRETMPTEFLNMTGFNLLPQEEIEKHGWHQVTSVLPDIDDATTVPGEVIASYHPKKGFTLSRLDRAMTEEERTLSDAAFNAKQKARRAVELKADADPLFMKFQRGEGTRAAWLAKVEEIRQRYPYRGMSDGSQ